VRITARADYAVRAVVELAGAGSQGVRGQGVRGQGVRSAEDVAGRQDLPRVFLLGILSQLRRAGLVASVRGSAGGWRLAQPAEAITLAMVVRAVEGPLAWVSEARPEDAHCPGSAAPLQLVWIALRASIRDVLEHVTVADVVNGTLPDHVLARTHDDAWRSR
jgi:Rrf2 family protein